MRDAGYIAAGYLLTGGVVATYTGWLRVRLQRTLRRTAQAFPDGEAR